MKLPIDRFCNFIYAWLVAHTEDRERLDWELDKPEPGRVRDSDVEGEKEEFANFMSALGR